MVQTPPVTSTSERHNDLDASWKENLCFLQLVLAWKSDIMYGVSSDASGLKRFEGHARPDGYVSEIRRLTSAFWEDDGVMKDDLQNGAFRTRYLSTFPWRFLGCVGMEREGIDYECLESKE